VTETVYRKQLRPVLTGGAQVMDTLFNLSPDAASSRGRRTECPSQCPSGMKEAPRPVGRRGFIMRLIWKTCWWAILGLNQ
jgi:hypothetical protein